MINKTQAHLANEILFLQDFFTIDERREFFHALSVVFCFTCGEARGNLGECPCLIQKQTEQQEDPRFLPPDMGDLP